MTSLYPPTLQDLIKARDRIKDTAVHTPLLQLHADDPSARIYLKLENLQPIGSFKIRGAVNAIRSADPDTLMKGVFTASAGNMAQGVALAAKRSGIACTVIVPDHAPATKIAAIERLGGQVIKVPFDRWWDVMMSGEFPGLEGLFIHPVCDQNVITGNGTIGLEILEDLPDVETIIVPFGGGGMTCGIASAIKASGSSASIIASEVETAAPLTASLAAGCPAEVDYQASFVDGIGAGKVLSKMWPLITALIDGTKVVSLAQIAAAIKLLAERQRVIAEGAGGSSLAAALDGAGGNGKTVCVISGGNLDFSVFTRILAGEVP